MSINNKHTHTYSLAYDPESFNLEIENRIPEALKQFLQQDTKFLPQHTEGLDLPVLDVVYALNHVGVPIQPCTPRIARKWLESGKCKITCKSPFTVQFTKEKSWETSGNSLNIFSDSRGYYLAVIESSGKEVFNVYCEELGKVEHLFRVVEEVKRLVPVDSINILTYDYQVQTQSISPCSFHLSFQSWWYHYREHLSPLLQEAECAECGSTSKLTLLFGLSSESLSFFHTPTILCEYCDSDFRFGNLVLKTSESSPSLNTLEDRDSVLGALADTLPECTTYSLAEILYKCDELNLDYSIWSLLGAMSGSLKSLISHSYQWYEDDSIRALDRREVVRVLGETSVSYRVETQLGRREWIERKRVTRSKAFSSVFLEHKYSRTHKNKQIKLGSFRLPKNRRKNVTTTSKHGTQS